MYIDLLAFFSKPSKHNSLLFTHSSITSSRRARDRTSLITATSTSLEETEDFRMDERLDHFIALLLR
jgi:hypothetical protein